jgi:ABC-type lipoprotein release transport system permease subunit
MDARQIARRSLTYYWRTNLAVVLGVATAVAVLAGALLVGDSVRGSLRDLALARLGETDLVVASTGLFREQLALDLAGHEAFASTFEAVAPLMIAEGLVTNQDTGRRVGRVRVYGVDDRFWRLHLVEGVSGPADREGYVSPALADELGVAGGDPILVRVQRPTDVPIESLHGRRDDLGRTIRLTVGGVLPTASLGEFSLEAQQGDVRAVFVPLARLQQDLEVAGQVNALLVSARANMAVEAWTDLQALVRSEASLEDVGFTVNALPDRQVIVVGSGAGLLDDLHVSLAAGAVDGSVSASESVFTYLANGIRKGDRDVPYSLVTATRLSALTSELASLPAGEGDPIILNEWAADDLRAGLGDLVTMEYYAWEDPGQLVTRTAEFRVAGVVPIGAGGPDLAPSYPGITDSPTLDDWDPPFPVDLRRVRRVDEEYWEAYRTTPKAFVPLEVGQRLWRSRYGAVTSIRMTPVEGQALESTRVEYAERLRAAADPLALGLAVVDVRTASLKASRGTTDFGEYFVYFSFFIVVSALLLVVLFFKLGVEQRVREVGLLRAVGFGPAAVRALFLREGVLLAVVGSLAGVLAAVGYAWLMMFGLRSWWVDAVGTTALVLHISPVSLVGGAVGGVGAAVACIWWTLRSLSHISERSLLAGDLESPGAVLSGPQAGGRGAGIATCVLAALGGAMVLAGSAAWMDRVGAFFGAGAALLVASLCGASWMLRRRSSGGLSGRGWWPVSRLGLRNVTYRPGRSVVSIAVIASATFILIAVDAFRRGDGLADTGPATGMGGYGLLVETLLPVVHDPNTDEGREALNLFGLEGSVRFEPFRLLPGDDASCLNLYEPQNPRVIAPTDAFLVQGRFSFQGSLATTDAERANPWLLLLREEPDGAIPVIADANSMTYVLHRQLGDDIVLDRGGREIRLRLVAALRDSVLQGELVMASAPFVELFPDQDGYRVLLVETTPEHLAATQSAIEDGLSDLGAGVVGTAARLAQFHRVENTFLSTFQTLGGLGLLLGTVGLATVLLRNVLERRRELALLEAVGYRRRHLLLLVVAENALLLGGGLAAGAISAVLAIAPALAERGGRIPLTGGGALLLTCVFAAGLLSSVVAMRAATHAPLLSSLRAE